MPGNTALDMLRTCERELPCDIFIAAAEVSKWRLDPSSSGQLLKPQGSSTLELKLIGNPNIGQAIGTRTDKRPTIVVGFVAETENVIENGRSKLATEGCDLIVATDLSALEVFASDQNTVHLIADDSVETWSRLSQREIARRLMHVLAAKLPATGKG
jgi:phosphopantothenoylcysteine decarboxylase/phosphopantothenate--cysteine ligase